MRGGSQRSGADAAGAGGDVGETGIIITGGGAYLRGLDRRIQRKTGIRTRIAPEADFCVVKGTGESLKYIDMLRKNSLNRRETYI